MSLDATSVIKVSDGIISADLNGETIAMNPLSGHYMILNQSAAAILRLAGSPLSVQDLCARLSEMFKGPASVIEADVLSACHDMIRLQIIETA